VACFRGGARPPGGGARGPGPPRPPPPPLCQAANASIYGFLTNRSQLEAARAAVEAAAPGAVAQLQALEAALAKFLRSGGLACCLCSACCAGNTVAGGKCKVEPSVCPRRITGCHVRLVACAACNFLQRQFQCHVSPFAPPVPGCCSRRSSEPAAAPQRGAVVPSCKSGFLLQPVFVWDCRSALPCSAFLVMLCTNRACMPPPNQSKHS
jgi:hypothetical protein